jgi:hypothetical protein
MTGDSQRLVALYDRLAICLNHHTVVIVELST